MKPNAINYLSLARKAGRIEVGEEPTGAAARAQHARLVILASDAPDNTCRRARNFISGTSQQLITVPFTKEELGAALGRSVVSMATITDPSLALAFVKALDNESLYAEAIEDLSGRAKRVRQHQLEERAHQKNLRQGHKKKHPSPAPAPAADETPRQAKPATGKSFSHGKPTGKGKPYSQGKPVNKGKPYAEGKPESGRKPGFHGKPTGKFSGSGKGPRQDSRRFEASGAKKAGTGTRPAGRKPGKKSYGGAKV